MINYWKDVMTKNYANFNGRARRSEYWYFSLMNFIIVMAVYILMAIAIFATKSATVAIVFGALLVVFMLATIVPNIAVLVRRLHDTGKSGWFYFVSLIPLAGPIWLLVLLFTDSTPGDNEYGPNPKTGSDVDLINTIK